MRCIWSVWSSILCRESWFSLLVRVRRSGNVAVCVRFVGGVLIASSVVVVGIERLVIRFVNLENVRNLKRSFSLFWR